MQTTNSRISLFTLLFLVFSLSSFAQPSERIISKDQYIDFWKDEAIRQMVLYKIPASITLAQGILESAHGNSELARYGNNHFGIKCHERKGETIHKDDDKANECFRKYYDARESYEDHSKFLAHRSRYAELFTLAVTDYKGWAHGLKKAGYATNPKYAYLLIDLIEKHELYKYDQMSLYVSDIKPKEIEQNTINSPVALPSTPAVNVHQVKLMNSKTKYIVAKEGDTFYKIAKEFDLALWQLYKYNEYMIEDVLKPGDIVYLQPKRNKSEVTQHTVKKGESIALISQKYGVKTKSLYKKNAMDYGTEPVVGQVLKLQ
jgi:LysM repeat protein